MNCGEVRPLLEDWARIHGVTDLRYEEGQGSVTAVGLGPDSKEWRCVIKETVNRNNLAMSQHAVSAGK